MEIRLTPQEKERVKELALQFHSKMAIIDGTRVVLPYDKWYYEAVEHGYEEPRARIPEDGTGCAGNRI